MASWSLLIPGYFPPSPNRTRGLHWSRTRKEKSRALEYIYTGCLTSGGGVPAFVGPVKVTIYRLWGKRQRALDRDNLYAACKPLIDAMRAEKAGGGKPGSRQGGLGIFEDDDEGKMELMIGQHRHNSPAAIALMNEYGIKPNVHHRNQQATLIHIEGAQPKRTSRLRSEMMGKVYTVAYLLNGGKGPASTIYSETVDVLDCQSAKDAALQAVDMLFGVVTLKSTGSWRKWRYEDLHGSLFPLEAKCPDGTRERFMMELDLTPSWKSKPL